MRILHLLASRSYSGAENVVIQIINMFKANSNIEMIYVSLKGPIEEKLLEENINYALLDNISLKSVKKVINEYNPDIIHAHDFTMSIMAAIAKKNNIVISHLHNNPYWIKKINMRSIAYYLVTKKIDRILLVSQAIKDEYIFSTKLHNKMIIIGNPVNTLLHLSQDNFERKDIDILFVGRITEQKNPLLFLDIINALNKKGMNLNVVMAGDGDLMQDVEEKIFDLNITNVHLTGFTKEPYSLMKKSKIICIPSKWEGFGLVAVEGLSFGLPVIASKVGGLKDIVNDDCGKLCCEKDEYINEILKLITNDEYYNIKSRNARKRALSLDNISDYKKRLIDIYEINN